MHDLEPNIEVVLVKSPPGDRDLKTSRCGNRHIGHTRSLTSPYDTEDRRANNDVRRRAPVVWQFGKYVTNASEAR